jgi:hypothetical protein
MADPRSDDLDGRLVCPFCAQEMLSNESCGGSFLDVKHPAVVYPVLVPAGSTVDQATEIMATARATYAR